MIVIEIFTFLAADGNRGIRTNRGTQKTLPAFFLIPDRSGSAPFTGTKISGGSGLENFITLCYVLPGTVFVYFFTYHGLILPFLEFTISANASSNAFILPLITSGFFANLCLNESCISFRNSSSPMTPDTATTAASIGELG